MTPSHDDDQEQGAASPEGPLSAAVRSSDRTLSLLAYVTAVMTILVLVFVAYLVFAVTNKPLAPRTATERVLYRLEAAVDESPDNPSVWAQYAAALVANDQVDQAQTVVNEAEDFVGESPFLDVERARIALAKDDPDTSLDTLESAIEALLGEREAELDKLRDRGVMVQVSSFDPEIVRAYILLGDVHEALNDYDAQIEAYDEALAFDPTMADIYVERGHAHASAGDAAAARADYETALELIPDFEPAVSGLAALEE